MAVNRRTARLVLEDGSVWHGQAFGAEGTQPGEVVFNTGMTGYQEVLTDPSYAGQAVVMTAPHIGNTGINLEDDESRRIFLNGFIVRELSPTVSNWRAHQALDAWMRSQGVIGISEVDTRAITRRLRQFGTMKGILSTEADVPDARLLAEVRLWPGLDNIDMVRAVSCEEPYHWVEATGQGWEFDPALKPGEARFHVVAYDFGIKQNILRRLASHGCRVTVVPAWATAEEVMAYRPDGVFLSNGPGDPSALPYVVKATRDLLGQVPVFGICLGHQIMGQAFGGKTYRLKFGHHGANQPVKHLPDGSVEISTHNHNFAVDPATLPAEVEVTHVNLNDQCCEGMRHKTVPAFSVQYHPEAGPGPHDSDRLFEAFTRMMSDWAGEQKKA